MGRRSGLRGDICKRLRALMEVGWNVYECVGGSLAVDQDFEEMSIVVLCILIESEVRIRKEL